MNQVKDPFIFQLVSKWKILLLIAFFGGVTGILIGYLIKPKYESRMTFALDGGQDQDFMSGAFSLASQLGFGGDVGGLFEGENILEIMKSRRIIEAVLLTADTYEKKPITLADYYMKINGIDKKLNKKERTKGISFPVGVQKAQLSYLQDSILKVIYEEIILEDIFPSRTDKKLSLFELRVQSRDERFTKVFTDRLALMSGEFYTEITSKKERETVAILEQRVDSIRKAVAGSLYARASVMDANLNPAFAIAQADPNMKQYNIAAYSEALKELMKNLELAKYQYIRNIPLIQVIDQADYPMKRIKTSKLKLGILFAIAFTSITIFFLWLRSFRFFLEQKVSQPTAS
jgi:uncharacterized protein involved in exopolysaccharide biosynthesis